MIRLHEHAAVLVVREPEALEELLATESVAPCLGPRLSDTAAWVDHHRAETLRELLVRAGYTPRATRDATGVRDAS